MTIDTEHPEDHTSARGHDLHYHMENGVPVLSDTPLPGLDLPATNW